MRHEIADSDDELDIASLRPILTKKNPENTLAPLERDPLADTEFDEFLSPTQRLSSYDGNNDANYNVATSNLLDSSTDRFLKEILPASSSSEPVGSHTAIDHDGSIMGGKQRKGQESREKDGKKRSRTQIEQDDKTTLFDSVSSRKRGKTYASARSTLSSNEAADLRSLITGSKLPNDDIPVHNDTPEATNTIDPAALVSIDPRSGYTSPLDLSLSLPVANGAHEDMLENEMSANLLQAPGYHPPPQPFTPNTSFFGANLHGGTASRSSMGGYQSFSINPNELGMGYGEINPFGRLSQVTDLDEADSEETRAIANIFRNSGTNSSKSAASDLRVDSVQEMQTSPIKSRDVNNAPISFTTEENLPNESPNFSQITDQGEEISERGKKQSEGTKDAAETKTTAAVQPQEATAMAPPKKRGRKPKRTKSGEIEAEEQNDVDESHLDELHVTRNMRAGTVDSVSNASDISHGTTSSKRTNKRKSKQVNIQASDVLSKKLPSSDLGLNDKNIIGLSPERYVPRPSRRRGRVEPEPEVHEAQESSQTKTPASQDEQFVADEIPNTSTPAKSKRGRKSKVKRAKTSVVRLSGKSDDLLDEDEKEEAKEVVFMDERPAKVKFPSLPEFSPDRKLKKEALEETAGSVADNNEDGRGDEVAGERAGKVTVDVPPLPPSDDHQELPPPVPEPKKRGRKRKTVVTEPVEDVQEQSDKRLALAETDGNIQAISRKAGKSSSKSDVELPRNDSVEADEENTKPASTDSSHTRNTARTGSMTPAPAPIKQVHSPLKSASTTPNFNVRARIGLSKRHSIPSLLRKVDRNKDRPKAIERKEKLTKAVLEAREQERIAREEAEAEGREYVAPDMMRGKDGMLVEWDF